MQCSVDFISNCNFYVHYFQINMQIVYIEHKSNFEKCTDDSKKFTKEIYLEL
jgi:hypothetical protein